MITLDGPDVVNAGRVSGEADVLARAALRLAVLMSEAPEPEVVDVPLRAEIWDSETALKVLMAVHRSRDEADTVRVYHFLIQTASCQIGQGLRCHLPVIPTCRRQQGFLLR
jgi:hypothetical protein